MNVLFLCGRKALFEEQGEGGEGDVGKGRVNRYSNKNACGVVRGMGVFPRIRSRVVGTLDGCSSKVKARQLNSPLQL